MLIVLITELNGLQCLYILTTTNKNKQNCSRTFQWDHTPTHTLILWYCEAKLWWRMTLANCKSDCLLSQHKHQNKTKEIRGATGSFRWLFCGTRPGDGVDESQASDSRSSHVKTPREGERGGVGLYVFVLHSTSLSVAQNVWRRVMSKSWIGKDGHWNGCRLIPSTIIQFLCRTWQKTRGKLLFSVFRPRFKPARYCIPSKGFCFRVCYCHRAKLHYSQTSIYLSAQKFLLSRPSCPHNSFKRVIDILQFSGVWHRIVW